MKNLTNKKKISLNEFKEIQLSVSQLNKLKGGSGVSNCSGYSTSCSGSDHDTGPSDND